MDKELVKGTRGLAADKFIVGESGKIRGTGKGKLPPEGLPRDLSDPERARLSVEEGVDSFRQRQRHSRVIRDDNAHEMADVSQAGSVELQSQTDLTVGALGSLQYNCTGVLAFFPLFSSIPQFDHDATRQGCSAMSP